MHIWSNIGFCKCSLHVASVIGFGAELLQIKIHVVDRYR
jgi:hypothetical protein